MEGQKLVKATVVSQALGIAQSTIYRMAQQGKIPSYIVGTNGVRFDIEEVREALRRPIPCGASGERVKVERIHSNGTVT